MPSFSQGSFDDRRRGWTHHDRIIQIDFDNADRWRRGRLAEDVVPAQRILEEIEKKRGIELLTVSILILDERGPIGGLR